MPELGRIHVGIDATPVLVAQRTGIERYATALVRELGAIYPTIDDIRLSVYMHVGNPYMSLSHFDEISEVLRAARIPYRAYTKRRGYGVVLSAYTAIDRLDLLHMLPRARPRFQICPYLLTIYDIQSVGLSKEGLKIERSALSTKERKVIVKATGLITISRSTTSDLMTEFGADLKMPVRAIHLGVDAAYLTGQEHAQAMREKYGFGRYIFFVGSLQYRKNLPRLIEAFAKVKRTHRIPHKLVLAGRDGWGSELVYAAVKQQGIESEVVFPGYVPESDLPGLYADADVFAYPSLHEGFGIPLLEAMASGTIILTSSLFSIPEVAGDAAVYVDPYDVDDIANNLWRAISDESLRCELRSKGKERVRQFAWDRMAQETLQFYRQIGMMRRYR